jgi:hypothetical protein
MQQTPYPEFYFKDGRNDVKSHRVGLVGENKLEPRPRPGQARQPRALGEKKKRGTARKRSESIEKQPRKKRGQDKTTK